jgi:hypothetical protein
MDQSKENLRRALARCLESIHDYFGLSDAEMKVALDDAEANPDWSPFDDRKWHTTAYPKAPAD